MKRSKPIGRRRYRDEAAAYEATSMARFAHAGYQCEADWHPNCWNRTYPHESRIQIHHVHMRRHGGTDDFENLRAVCEACHHRIHQRPNEAAERGLLIPKGRLDTPIANKGDTP